MAGLVSELNGAIGEAALNIGRSLSNTIATKLLPIMLKGFEAQFVTPVTVNVGRMQGYLSFAKIALLHQRFGANRARELVTEGGAYSGIEMLGLDVLNRLAAVTGPVCNSCVIASGFCGSSSGWVFDNRSAFHPIQGAVLGVSVAKNHF